MSESQKAGNRPPAPRIVRPFTGGTTSGQGNQPSSPRPAGGATRPGQPLKPFAGAQRTTVAPIQPQATPIGVAALTAEPIAPTPAATAAITLETEVETPAPRTAEPTHHEPLPAPIAHEAWERYVAPEIERLSEPPRALIAEAQKPEITLEEAEVEGGDLNAKQSSESTPHYRKSAQPITIEVPAIPSDEAMAAIRDVASEGEFWEAAYASTPKSAPEQDVAKETVEAVVIDEVDAAFESAQPSSDSSRLAEVLVAAATLETIARRLRNGEIDLRPAAGANMSNEETALATVLAALLANR